MLSHGKFGGDTSDYDFLASVQDTIVEMDRGQGEQRPAQDADAAAMRLLLGRNVRVLQQVVQESSRSLAPQRVRAGSAGS